MNNTSKKHQTVGSRKQTENDRKFYDENEVELVQISRDGLAKLVESGMSKYAFINAET